MPNAGTTPGHPRDLTHSDIFWGMFELPELMFRGTMADMFAKRAPATARRWLSVLGDCPTIEGEWLGIALRRRYGPAVEYNEYAPFGMAAE